jgi:ArsR family transcriptional regulator
MKKLTVLQPLCCGLDTPPMPREAAGDLAEAFKALADPTRVAIVNRLSMASAVCVCDLTAAFRLSQPILRDAGLIDVERRGTWMYYRLVPEAVARLRHVFEASPRDLKAAAG